MTAENVVEDSSDNFGNSWKTDKNCADVKPRPHPCDQQKQRASFADTHCNKLHKAPFTKCHHVVVPEDYVSSCRWDVCSMENSLKVMCDAISAYTKACADHGVVIDWKNTGVIGECGKFSCNFATSHVEYSLLNKFVICSILCSSQKNEKNRKIELYIFLLFPS